MHIPDGYLGPQTYIPAYAVMIPLWALAAKRVQRTLRMRQVPLLALGAAFSFLIMMFNIPIPGGTSGHAAGGVLIAILLGPWAAIVAVSLALAVQALLFGDGGITTFAANCLNIAVFMPLAGWGVYRLLAGTTPSPRWRAISAGVGGYVGLNVAALTTALMFGLQPLLAQDTLGRATFAPYSLNIALPAMMISHLLLIGLVEALVTGLVLAYLQRNAPDLLPQSAPARADMPALRRVVIGLGLLALLTPLGLFIPAMLNGGTAWGEWGADELQRTLGYVPQGIAQAAERAWPALLPDYALPGQSSPLVLGLAYLLSAVLGAGALALLVLGVRRLWGKDADEPLTGLDGATRHG